MRKYNVPTCPDLTSPSQGHRQQPKTRALSPSFSVQNEIGLISPMLAGTNILMGIYDFHQAALPQ